MAAFVNLCFRIFNKYYHILLVTMITEIDGVYRVLVPRNFENQISELTVLRDWLTETGATAIYHEGFVSGEKDIYPFHQHLMTDNSTPVRAWMIEFVKFSDAFLFELHFREGVES